MTDITLVSEEEFLSRCEKKLNKVYFSEDASLSEQYIILIKGKRVKLKSGKSVWKGIGAAKSALRNHLRIDSSNFYVVDNDKVNYSKGYQLINQAQTEWINKYAIFMPLFKWVEHMGKM